MMTSYTPVSYDFRDLVDERISAGQSGKLFFFNKDNVFDSVEGKVVKMFEVSGKGMFIELEPFVSVRIDRIITLFGKPGPAFDEYDRLGNVCMECTGGYDD